MAASPKPIGGQTAPAGWRDPPAEAPGAAIPTAGALDEAEPPEPDWLPWDAVEAVAEPPRRPPGGRLPRPLTAAEALRLDRRVRGAYLDRALLRNR